jgi:integrase
MSRGQGPGSIRRVRLRGRWRLVADWTDEAGRRRRRILGRDRDTVQRLLVEEIRRRDRSKAGLSSELGQDTALGLLAADYLAELATRCTPKHVRLTGDQLARLPGILHVRQVRDLRPENYERYRQRQLRTGLASATVNSGLVALNGMLRWAVSTRRIAENPMESIKVLPTGRAHQKRPKRALTEAEIEAFLRAAYAADAAASERMSAIRTIRGGTQGARYAVRPRPERVPLAPLLRFLIETGARWNEARQVTWADLDFARCRLTLRPATTKNRRGRVLPLKSSMVEELQGLAAAHHRALGRAPRTDDSVFLTARGKGWPADTGRLRRLLGPIWKAAGIERENERGEHVDVHSLRHSAATRLARAGWPMAKLQRFMGHADPRTTQRYYDHLEVEDLEDALELVPPLVSKAHVDLNGTQPKGKELIEFPPESIVDRTVVTTR